jgi:hypothetical protein
VELVEESIIEKTPIEKRLEALLQQLSETVELKSICHIFLAQSENSN